MRVFLPSFCGSVSSAKSGYILLFRITLETGLGCPRITRTTRRENCFWKTTKTEASPFLGELFGCCNSFWFRVFGVVCGPFIVFPWGGDRSDRLLGDLKGGLEDEQVLVFERRWRVA